MLKKRIIPCLVLRAGGVARGINFINQIGVGLFLFYIYP